MQNLDHLIFGLLCSATFATGAVALLPAAIAAASVPGVLLGASCAVAAVGFIALGVRRAFGY